MRPNVQAITLHNALHQGHTGAVLYPICSHHRALIAQHGHPGQQHGIVAKQTAICKSELLVVASERLPQSVALALCSFAMCHGIGSGENT
jgi:hypothetical protein